MNPDKNQSIQLTIRFLKVLVFLMKIAELF